MLVLLFQANWVATMIEAFSMQIFLLQVLLISFILLSSVEDSNAGITSSFVRTQWPSVDIPLDHEVFAVPKGYNAPQQVNFYTCKFITFWENVWGKFMCSLLPEKIFRTIVPNPNWTQCDVWPGNIILKV